MQLHDRAVQDVLDDFHFISVSTKSFLYSSLSEGVNVLRRFESILSLLLDIK